MNAVRKLSEAEIAASLDELSGWELADGRLRRDLKLGSFAAAWGFMAQMALVSERLGHHPDWSNVYDRVRIELWTHDVGGLTALDFAWAREADRVLEAAGPRARVSLVELGDDPERSFTTHVRQWLQLIAANRWEEAVARLDAPAAGGVPWTARALRTAIEIEHLGPDSPFARAHPEGILYDDPDDLEGDGSCGLAGATGDGVLRLDHRVPLNGAWSPLILSFELIERPGGYAFALRDLRAT